MGGADCDVDRGQRICTSDRCGDHLSLPPDAGCDGHWAHGPSTAHKSRRPEVVSRRHPAGILRNPLLPSAIPPSAATWSSSPRLQPLCIHPLGRVWCAGSGSRRTTHGVGRRRAVVPRPTGCFLLLAAFHYRPCPFGWCCSVAGILRGGEHLPLPDRHHVRRTRRHHAHAAHCSGAVGACACETASKLALRCPSHPHGRAEPLRTHRKCVILPVCRVVAPERRRPEPKSPPFRF